MFVQPRKFSSRCVAFIVAIASVACCCKAVGIPSPREHTAKDCCAKHAQKTDSKHSNDAGHDCSRCIQAPPASVRPVIETIKTAPVAAYFISPPTYRAIVVLHRLASDVLSDVASDSQTLLALHCALNL